MGRTEKSIRNAKFALLAQLQDRRCGKLLGDRSDMIDDVCAVIGVFLFIRLARAAGIHFLTFVYDIYGAAEGMVIQGFFKLLFDFFACMIADDGRLFRGSRRLGRFFGFIFAAGGQRRDRRYQRQ